jgi:FAD/FMN-containing dehydrogenase
LGTDHYYKIVEEVKNLIHSSSEFTKEEKEIIQVTGYGHIGDGNLHLNIAIPGYDNSVL